MLRASFFLLFLVVSVASAVAGSKTALVIGNSAYAFGGVLANPKNDAETVSAALKAAGFDPVVTLTDLDKTQFLGTLGDFANAAEKSEIALIYYAGHGVEVDRRNFLVPVDAKLSKASEVVFQAISLDDVRAAVAGASKLRLVILDACRNNPFPLAKKDGTRALGGGLAHVEPGANELIAYAAREGTLATDGAGGNSPFAVSFVRELAQPGLDVGFLFRRVRDDVLAATGQSQEPFVYGTLGGDALYLNAPEGSAGVPAAAVSSASTDWIAVHNSGSKAALRAYLDKYSGDPLYGALAKAALADAKAAQTPAASNANPAPAPAPQVAMFNPPASLTPSNPVPQSTEPLNAEGVESALNLKVSGRAKIQSVLMSHGAKISFPSGFFGKETRTALANWQRTQAREPTGFATAADRDALIGEFRKKGPGAFPVALPLEPDDFGPDGDPRLRKAVAALAERPLRYAFSDNRVFIAVQRFETTWQIAQDEARAAGGDLASVDSAGKISMVYGLFGADDRFYGGGDSTEPTINGPWIGLVRDQDAKPPREGWHWLNGATLSPVFWGPGQPNFGTGHDNCGHFFSPGKLNPKADQRPTMLDDMACDHVMQGYIMEIGPLTTGGAQDGAASGGQQATIVPPAPPEPPTPEASETALALTDDERKGVKAALLKVHVDPGNINSEFDSETRAAIKSWQYTESLPVTGFLDETELSKLIGKRGESRDFKSRLAVSYSETPKGADPRLARAISALAGYPIVFSVIDKHLFIAVPTMPRRSVTFDNANKLAKSAGGTLAMIESASQNKALFELIADDPRFWAYSDNGPCEGPWIGLLQAPGSRTSKVGWQTVERETLKYTNWYRSSAGGGAPSAIDDGAGVGAATFGGGQCDHPIAKWNDAPMMRAHKPGFIMEIK